MKRFFKMSAILAICAVSVFAEESIEPVSENFIETNLRERLMQHVYILASDSLRGRKAGTKYARMAADYIVSQFEEIGIEPFFDDSYLQFFGKNFQNVVGIIRGNDPVLKNEYIVIGAHYDGDRPIFGRIRNAADDNASGTATLIEIGRELKRNQSNLKRSVILVAFDAHEGGVFGAAHFVDNWEQPLENIKFMISVDMIGRYERKNRVEYIGTATIKNGAEMILNPQIVPEGLNIVAKNFETHGTDSYPFAIRRIPTLHIFTGRHSHYHTSKDEAHLIDYDGLSLITEHLINLTKAISQDEDFAPSGRFSRRHLPRRKVDFGVSINSGGNYSGASSRSAYAFGAGLMSQVNFGIFAIRPEILYEHVESRHSSGLISSNNITFPLSLVLQTPELWILGGDIFFGGYYSHRFAGSQNNEAIDFNNAFNRGETGLTFGIGQMFNPFRFGFAQRIALTDFTQSSEQSIRNRTFYATISYRF